jgi:cytochrome c oxidase subunit 3
VSTLVPGWLSWRAACREQFRRMRFWWIVSTLLSAAASGARAWEIHALPLPWTSNAYASLVWMSIGFHTLDWVAGVLESIFLCAVLFRERVELKTFEDIESSAAFGFFGVLVWLPFAALFYLDGRFS